jgi:hypothetical protein
VSDISKAINDYFTAEDISWAKHVSICTDGAPAMQEYKKGFQDEALAPHDLESTTHSVLQEAVKVVNFVKACQLNSRLFAVLCDDMQADHKSLVLHSVVK